MYDHILVALDGSTLAERILPHAETLAENFGSTITLLRAVTPLERAVLPDAGAAGTLVDPEIIVEVLDEERQEAQSYLDQVAERLRARGLTVNCESPEGPAASAIIDYAREKNVNLIALTTHGHGGLGRLIFGSVADEVLRHVTCPAFLVRVHESGKH